VCKYEIKRRQSRKNWGKEREKERKKRIRKKGNKRNGSKREKILSECMHEQRRKQVDFDI
jgi:hypothetical protein